MMINRDPFAREELHRRNVYTTSGVGCDWCGRMRLTSTGKKYLYQYRVETDGGRVLEDRRCFCSVGCKRSYDG